LIWFVWSIWFIWFNQTNEADQINKRDQPVLALHAPQSVALPDYFSILLDARRVSSRFDEMGTITSGEGLDV
jgi:hypothetical protein